MGVTTLPVVALGHLFDPVEPLVPDDDAAVVEPVLMPELPVEPDVDPLELALEVDCAAAVVLVLALDDDAVAVPLEPLDALLPELFPEDLPVELFPELPVEPRLEEAEAVEPETLEELDPTVTDPVESSRPPCCQRPSRTRWRPPSRPKHWRIRTTR